MSGEDVDILGGNQGTLLGNPSKGFTKENSTTKRVLGCRSQGAKAEGGRKGEIQKGCCGGMQEMEQSLSTSQKRRDVESLHKSGGEMLTGALPWAG